MSIFDNVNTRSGKPPVKKKIVQEKKKKPAAKKEKPPEKQKPEKKKPKENIVDINSRVGEYRAPLSKSEKDMAALIEESQRANLEEQILKNEKIRYQNEQERLKLMKNAGELIEFSLAEFLFTGYIEKLNTDILGMMKRLEPILTNLIKESDTKGVIKRVNKEIRSILIDVKKSQSDDVRKWKRER